MDVKRSDMLKWAQSAQLNAGSEDSKALDKPVDGVKVENRSQVSLDTMRSKVLSLQQEIRDLQTGISMRQIQIGFLNQVNEGSSWQKELKRFMNEQFPKTSIDLREGQNMDEFRSEAAQIVSNLRNNLIKKEIQIQNILSAGMFEPASADTERDVAIDNSKIMKDFSETKDIFSKLRPEAIQSLVN
ncbi:hypothetical protein [Turneriella parva]|uniref:Uncharacterized protein n=1 Tax=Turneriella parva (strain ATCC BAA-1111 / DSM 21527 / NCTC 11395 / H) TaxID=869212 RepID=I4B2B3_TURPD|nr:hypothetical protein [Turneriella parva]AFM11420.1 hypothetical protein Turpa_0769 [Turneriella parva DSM 21527]